MLSETSKLKRWWYWHAKFLSLIQFKAEIITGQTRVGVETENEHTSVVNNFKKTQKGGGATWEGSMQCLWSHTQFAKEEENADKCSHHTWK